MSYYGDYRGYLLVELITAKNFHHIEKKRLKHNHYFTRSKLISLSFLRFGVSTWKYTAQHYTI